MRTKNNTLHIEEENYVRLEDIIIPEDFQQSCTGKLKVIHAVEYYLRFGCFDKPVSVIAETNERGNPNTLVLVDEYSRYQAAINLNLEFIEATYIDINDIKL